MSQRKDDWRIRLRRYPAEYRSSGVMTLIIDKSGPFTKRILALTHKARTAMIAYDPDSTWHKLNEKSFEVVSVAHCPAIRTDAGS